MAVRASRLAWAAKQSSLDAGEGMNKMVDSLSSLASQDEGEVYRDPTDPTKVGTCAEMSSGMTG